ncbi:carnitine O-palmitoyltransferase 1, liver isoform-like isoform X2 [Haliotis rufescens]|nr:carnitine O-palmitoyltransferase 1, liver isoform-like isoform X1 [Haliotis rufescens]XP_048251118.1 carnitine O-palmitoyltransferase 1, liver isoform-like isoform X2 [Haliotis rufescens]
MAEARSAVSEPRVSKFEEDKTTAPDVLDAWRRGLLRRFFRTRNLIRNGMWPTSTWNLFALVTPLTALRLADWKAVRPITDQLHKVEDLICLPTGCPVVIKSVIGSVVVGLGFFIVVLYVRRFTLRALLSYRGWMYEPPKSQSVLTLIWGAMVRIVSGRHPLLYSCQRSLPRMSVPTLRHTLDHLLDSLKPLYGEDSEEFQTLKAEAKVFEQTQGPKLQRMLVLKSWWSQNWVSDWWEKYVYLMSRSPLPINSNYYVMDQNSWIPTHRPTSRAATCIYQMMVVKQKLDREQFDPLVIRNTIPVCMAQYERVFSTTRIPGEDMDIIQHKDPSESKHIVVLRKGVFYKVNVYSPRNRPVPPQVLEKQFQSILEDAEAHQDSLCMGEESLPALTTLDRTSWAKIRMDHFSHGVNKESLDILEGAILFLSFDTHSFKDYSPRAKYLLHGDGKSIWFDKSINLIFFSDGRFGMNNEHSFADAPVVAHVQEFNMLNEVIGLHDTDGYAHPVPCEQTENVKPVRLIWNIDTGLGGRIKHAMEVHQQNCENLQIVVSDFQHFGKSFIKKCKVSPDAFLQMALQVTYFRNAGKFALTYEASMTRLYLAGRTETVRSLTMESVDFVKAFLDKNVPGEEKIRLLLRACENHQIMYKDAMNGLGIDRHLFALYVASRGLGDDCEFLKKALSIPWTLSTSQQPQQQIFWAPDCSLPQYFDKVSPGGGFGPVSDDGYGVSYMIPGENRFFFHVSSKRNTSNTNSMKFTDQLFQTLQEIKELFDAHLKT